MLLSHNTFSYLRPAKAWMWPLQIAAKCQNRDIAEQAALGVECADIRLRLHRGQWWVCHGIVRYVHLHDALTLLDAVNIHHLRILLEGRYTAADSLALSDLLLARHFNIVEMRDKKTFNLLDGRPLSATMLQYVGSVQSKWGKLCPWLWHKRNLKGEKEALTDLVKGRINDLALDFA